jgi:hypothetical protein
MKYLHLKFENCGLVSGKRKMKMGKWESSSPHLTKMGEITQSDIDTQNYGNDFSNPIPYTLLSNVLHVLCGEIPIPTKRKTTFSEKYKRNEELDKIALNSYIRYDNQDIEVDDYNLPKQKEFISSNKWHWNSEYPNKTTFKLADGTTKIGNGYYSWNIFKRHCGDTFNEKVEILNNIIGMNSLKLTFDELVYELSKYWDSTDFSIYEKKFPKSWYNVLFTKNNNNNSTTYPQSRTPILTNNGEAFITYINGEIICPIENDEIIDAIINNGNGSATLLEHGIVYVNAIENFEPIFNFKETFTKIF